MTDRVKELEDRIDALEKEHARYRGFVGGVIFIVTSLWAFIELVWPQLSQLIKKLS